MLGLVQIALRCESSEHLEFDFGRPTRWLPRHAVTCGSTLIWQGDVIRWLTQKRPVAHFGCGARHLRRHQHRMPREPPGGYRWLTARCTDWVDFGRVTSSAEVRNDETALPIRGLIRGIDWPGNVSRTSRGAGWWWYEEERRQDQNLHKRAGYLVSLLATLPERTPNIEVLTIEVYAQDGCQWEHSPHRPVADSALKRLGRLREIHFRICSGRWGAQETQFSDDTRKKLPDADAAGLLVFSAGSSYTGSHIDRFSK
ncbi:hypothetical protein C8R45DRAFT_928575 [Mycena sanguinolenta]|nr:hypothetical protein C8R45DRAFT_928575 [Mycena sanguinolenta]